MDIDLLEDRLSAQFIYDEGFTLYELYDLKERLNSLENIINSMIDTSASIGFNDDLAEQHRQLGILIDNMISVDKVIDYYENKTFQSLGKYGDLSLN
jgi:hypothetical protein